VNEMKEGQSISLISPTKTVFELGETNRTHGKSEAMATVSKLWQVWSCNLVHC
jgi:hypothetical protein